MLMSESQLRRFYLTMKVFKEKKGSILLTTEVADQIHHHHPLCADLSVPCAVSLDAICSQSSFRRLLKGSRGDIWSSVDYFVFISICLLWGKNQQVRPSICDQKMWKVCLDWRWVDYGAACFKVSCNILGWPKVSFGFFCKMAWSEWTFWPTHNFAMTRQMGTPAENSLLQ